MSFSRDPALVLQEALQKNYTRVRFQQGKTVLDRELNLLADLVSPQRLAAGHIGDGVPAGSNGFRISNVNAATGDFIIEAGRCLVAGLEIVLANNTTYKTQPNKGNVAPLPAGNFNVFLRVFPTLVTQAADPTLNNAGAGDVGVVTSLREKADWEVIVSAAVVTPPNHMLLATVNAGTGVITDRRRTGLTLAVIRDEVAGARGTATTLGPRLDASLAPNGALKPGVVGGAQLAPNAVGETNLANNAVSKRTIADGAVSVSKLNPAAVLNTQVTVPAAPAAGQFGELVVSIEVADEHAFYLVSARYIAPRPTLLIPTTNILHPFNWVHRAAVVKRVGATVLTHEHQLVLQNFNTFPITVACKAYRVAEV